MGALTIIVMVAVNGLEDDGPSGRKDGVMDVQFIGLEGETGKDRRDGDGLAIG